MDGRAARLGPPNADYDALFELAGTPLLELDGNGQVLRCNAAAARLLDATPANVRGTMLDELLGVDITEALAADHPVPLESTVAGSRLSLVMSSFPRTMHSSDGAHFTVQLLAGDPTAQADAVRHGRALHWSAMDDLSHNLGTPLSVIAGYAETLLARRGDLDHDQLDEALAALHRHASRAIDELRAVQARVRLDAGGAGTVPVSVLLAWLRRMLRANLTAANAALIGSTSLDTITVDVAMARQILLNACTVALQTDPRPSVLELEVRLVEDGTEFVLRTDVPVVDDTVAARLTSEVTATLAERHAGSYDPPTPDDPSQRIVLPSSTTGPATPPAPAIPVALIEDDADTAALVRASLRSSSALFDVIVDERTFAAGLDAVASSAPRIILLDQELPDRVGSEGIEELREVCPDARIVVLSVHASAGRHDAVDVDTVWLEKGRVLADLGAELIGVLAGTGGTMSPQQ